MRFKSFPGAIVGKVLNLFAYYGNNMRTWATRPMAPNQPTLAVPYPTGDAQSDAAAYLRYLAAYNGYVDSEIQFYKSTGIAPHLEALLPHLPCLAQC